MTKFRLFHDASKPLVAMAFKTVLQKHGQLTLVRIYQGQLEKGQSVTNVRTRKTVRVGRLVRLHADEHQEIVSATAGDIVGIVGIDCVSGDTFTSDCLRVAMENMFVPDPVMKISVAPAKREQAELLAKALERFRREDPTFRVESGTETGETLLSGMGQLHLDVYLERLKTEFKCDCIVGKPLVAYKERPSQAVEFSHLFSKQTGGPGQFAKIIGTMEPLPADSDEPFVFEDQIVGGRIERKFIPAVKKGFEDGLMKGPLGGYEMFGVKVTLVDGEQHKSDSSEIAFRNCAKQVLVQKVFPEAAVKLWEPVMKIEVEVPTQFQGTVIGYLAKIRGVVTNSQVSEGSNEVCVIEAEVPLAEMFGFSSSFRSLTQGRASFSMELLGYREVPKSEQEKVLAERNRGK